jgi:DNA-binding NarL/FixJ family response regulator
MAEALADDPEDGSDATAQPPDANDLTPREVEVLRLIAAGHSNREIATELSLSARTLERHITNLYSKIDARGRADATAHAFRHALV